jgi:plastocyanin
METRRHLNYQQGLVENGGKILNQHLNIKILTVALLLLYFPVQAGADYITGTVKVRGLRSPANILVYLARAPKADMELSKAKFVMDQRNLTFAPHILTIPMGATVVFPNHDKVDHNVFSLSRTKKFNLGSYKPGESETVRFDKPGIVELRCDVHAEMAAYIMVMKNGYFAVTDKSGRFAIPDARYAETYGLPSIAELPAGKYTLKTWHEKLKTQKQAVVVPNEGAVSIRLDLNRGTPGVLYK